MTLPVAPRALGALLVLGSALAFSLSGVFAKAIESDAWVIACWRGLIGATLIAVYVSWRAGRPFYAGGLRLGWRGWLMASVGSAASLAFIGAFKNTQVAHVAIIYATAPFAAALMERIALGVRVDWSTLAAAVVALVGVALMMSGDFASGFGGGSLLGDTLALVMTLGMALYMTLIRVFRQTPAVLAGAASALQLFLLGWLIAEPLAMSGGDALLVVLFGACFAAASILLTEGARLITAAESALFGAAETPLAALFAWLLLAEAMTAPGLAGGGVVLAAVLGKAFWERLRER